MHLLDRLRRLCAPNTIHRQLFPRPAVDFRFRCYREPDRDAVIELHDSNAPGRFPENHRPTFEKYLDSAPESFFVAESTGGEIIACGGVSLINERVNVLSYGLVSVKHQGCGIGSALTLARLAFATRVSGHNFSLIFAVPKSVGFYRRFGYVDCSGWVGEDGKENPVAMLTYLQSVFGPIEGILEERCLLIDPTLPITWSDELKAIVEEAQGAYNIHLEQKDPTQRSAISEFTLLNLLREAFPDFVNKIEGSKNADLEEMLPPLSDQEIADLESELGVPLPDSYQIFLSKTRGFWLFGGSIQLSSTHPFRRDFESLEKLSPQQRRGVKRKGGGWPPPSQGMLCFAEYFLEADGDQLLFDVSGGLVDGEYPVMYYSHETRSPGVRKIADSFAEWLNHHCVDDMEA